MSGEHSGHFCLLTGGVVTGLFLMKYVVIPDWFGELTFFNLYAI